MVTPLKESFIQTKNQYGLLDAIGWFYLKPVWLMHLIIWVFPIFILFSATFNAHLTVATTLVYIFYIVLFISSRDVTEGD